jgi:hypothetical protein
MICTKLNQLVDIALRSRGLHACVSHDGTNQRIRQNRGLRWLSSNGLIRAWCLSHVSEQDTEKNF